MSPLDRVRVIVADDHDLYRRSLVIELDIDERVEVAAEADNGEAAVACAIDLSPDVALIDLHMPGIGGVEAIRRIAEQAPATRCIALGVDDADPAALDAIELGAVGYLRKETSLSEIADASQRVAAGHVVLSPTLAERVGVAYERRARGLEHHTWCPPPLLSRREREVLDALARGAGDASIAAQLGMRIPATRTCIRNVVTRLHTASRAEAVLVAVRDGYVGH